MAKSDNYYDELCKKTYEDATVSISKTWKALAEKKANKVFSVNLSSSLVTDSIIICAFENKCVLYKLVYWDEEDILPRTWNVNSREDVMRFIKKEDLRFMGEGPGESFYDYKELISFNEYINSVKIGVKT